MIKVFIDSDVVISSLLSASGAAFCLVNQQSKVSLFISNLSQEELNRVGEKLGLDHAKLERLIKKMRIVKIAGEMKQIKSEFTKYVLDENDAHIVVGAQKAGAGFLITYNSKHFQVERIKDELKVIVMTPAVFLQYLRSL